MRRAAAPRPCGHLTVVALYDRFTFNTEYSAIRTSYMASQRHGWHHRVLEILAKVAGS
jgi:hypothetical protein